MEKQKGASIVIWIIGVILLAIVIVIAIHFMQEEINKNQQEDIKTEMLQVQAKAKIVLEKYNVDNNNGLKGQKMEDKTLQEKYGIEQIENYYKWTKEILAELGLQETLLQEGEYYLVNYDTEEVIYSQGYKAENGEIYYKLSEIK